MVSCVQMTDAEMMLFIEKVGSRDLFYELTQRGYPDMFLAIMDSLIALDYDEAWVRGKFRDALEKYYPGRWQRFA